MHTQPTADPTHWQSELDRKTFESLERLVAHNAMGKIGPEGLEVGVRAVWETTSGLVSNEISDMAAQMNSQIIATKPLQAIKRVFLKPDGSMAAAVSWVPGLTTVTVLANGRVRLHTHTMEHEAKAFFDKTCAALKARYGEF